MQELEEPPERESKRESEDSCERELTSSYTLAWRVFAGERRLTAERGLASLSTGELGARRRAWLPPPEVPRHLAAVGCTETKGCVLCVKLLPCGERIVTMDARGHLRGSAVKVDGAPLWEVAARIGEGYGLAMPKLAVVGERIVASGRSTEEVVRTWNGDTGELLCEIKVDGQGVGALAAINRRQFAVGCRCGDIGIYEHEQGAMLTQAFRFVHPKPNSGSLVVDFAVCGKRLASVVSNGMVTIWDLEKRSKVGVISGRGTEWVNGVDMSDSVVVTASYAAPHVRVYSVANNYSCIGATGAFNWVHSKVGQSVLILDSGHVMSTSEDETIVISALQSNEVVARMKLDFTPCISAILPDGSIAVTAVPLKRGYRSGVVIVPAPPAASRLLKARHTETQKVI